MTPALLERLTFKVWPDRPKDYSLETVAVRWDALKAVYQAERIREFKENRLMDLPKWRTK